jgi:hypothetical protein
MLLKKSDRRKMDLQTIIEKTPEVLTKASIATALYYPLFTGAISYLSKEKFTKTLKDPMVLVMTAGMWAGSIIGNYCYCFLK